VSIPHPSPKRRMGHAPFGTEIVTMDLITFSGFNHPAGAAQNKPPKLSRTRMCANLTWPLAHEKQPFIMCMGAQGVRSVP
jgi:hypothetical protein